jgi:hypothetical protein
MAATMRTAGLWPVTVGSLVQVCRRCRGSYCYHSPDDGGRRLLWNIGTSTRLNGVTPQNTAIFGTGRWRLKLDRKLVVIRILMERLRKNTQIVHWKQILWPDTLTGYFQNTSVKQFRRPALLIPRILHSDLFPGRNNTQFSGSYSCIL